MLPETGRIRADSGPLQLHIVPPQGISDFTVYLPLSAQRITKQDHDDVVAIQSRLSRLTEERGRRGFVQKSYSDSVILVYEDLGKKRHKEECRSLICPCLKESYYSITLRRTNSRKIKEVKTKKSDQFRRSPAAAFIKNRRSLPSPWDPHSSAKAKKTSRRASRASQNPPAFLCDQNAYSIILAETIFDARTSQGAETGLVIVAGATGASKSKIVQSLISRYLSDLVCRRTKLESRKPHLVTFEDPIETPFYRDPIAAQKCGFDYTAREKRKDAQTLSSALEDCLRQTPAAVYVGETRNLDEWRKLLDFAGTGHLVFTTSHAGSLTEMISTVRDALESETAAERSVLANHLLAIVHLQPVEVSPAKTKGAGRQAILLGLWLRSSEGTYALTSDGMAAILPDSGDQESSPTSQYGYGRAYFARKLISNNSVAVEYAADLVNQALRLDLGGL